MAKRKGALESAPELRARNSAVCTAHSVMIRDVNFDTSLLGFTSIHTSGSGRRILMGCAQGRLKTKVDVR